MASSIGDLEREIAADMANRARAIEHLLRFATRACSISLPPRSSRFGQSAG